MDLSLQSSCIWKSAKDEKYDYFWTDKITFFFFFLQPNDCISKITVLILLHLAY